VHGDEGRIGLALPLPVAAFDGLGIDMQLDGRESGDASRRQIEIHKQERKADHIAESYESRGVPEKEAERIAWATVNKESGGGKKSGSGRGQPESHASSQKGGRLGGQASARRPAAERSAAAKEAAATRKRPASS
jgi:hypothetical protein